MAKYYAVRAGRKPGIFTTWAEAEAQVRGFTGADFKSFTKLAEAEVYLARTPQDLQNIPKDDTNAYLNRLIKDLPTQAGVAFVDGSFNLQTKTYGYGATLTTQTRTHELSGAACNPDLAKHRNVAGELAGVRAVIELALNLQLTELWLAYDYMGIEKWATGEWRAKELLTQTYAKSMQTWQSQLTIHFIHVSAHTGVDGNERVDQLAKQAVGLSS